MTLTCLLLRDLAPRATALALAVTALPACAQIIGVEPDPLLVKPTCQGTLRVRITTDSTGAASDIAPPYNNGIFDYLRHLNDAEGGLRGCKIDIDMQEAFYQNDKTREVVEAWRKSPTWPEVSTVFIFGTGPTEFVAPTLTADRKLIIPGSYAGSLATPVKFSKDVSYPDVNTSGLAVDTTAHKASNGYPYVFFPATDYSTGIRLGILAASNITRGRIAMVHASADTCPYCVDPLVAGKAYVKQLGLTLGTDLIVPQTSLEADAPMITKAVVDYMQKEIDKKKADLNYDPVRWLWTGNSVFSSSFVAKGAAEAQKLIDAEFSDPESRFQIRVMANNWGIGETSGKRCGSDCADILYGLFPVPRYGDVQHALGMNEMMLIHDKYRGVDGLPIETYRDVRYVQGHAAALMWRKAVELAIDTGHRSPTGDDIKAALETFHEVELDGMTAGAISFTKTDHRPQMEEVVYKLNGKGELEYVDSYTIKRLGEWLGY